MCQNLLRVDSWLPFCSSAGTIWKTAHFPALLLLGKVWSCRSGWTTASPALTSRERRWVNLWAEIKMLRPSVAAAVCRALLPPRTRTRAKVRGKGRGSHCGPTLQLQSSSSPVRKTSPPCPNKQDFKAALSFCKGLLALAAKATFNWFVPEQFSFSCASMSEK